MSYKGVQTITRLTNSYKYKMLKNKTFDVALQKYLLFHAMRFRKNFRFSVIQ